MDRTFWTFSGALLVMSIKFCVARSLATSRSSSRPNSILSSRPHGAGQAARHRRRGDRMSSRREFITLLGGAAVVWPLVARAQQPAKLPTIGFLGASTPLFETQRVASFVQQLHELGWNEGRDVKIEYRWAEGRSERLAEIAAEFVRLKVDVIVTYGTPA